MISTTNQIGLIPLQLEHHSLSCIETSPSLQTYPSYHLWQYNQRMHINWSSSPEAT